MSQRRTTWFEGPVLAGGWWKSEGAIALGDITFVVVAMSCGFIIGW